MQSLQTDGYAKFADSPVLSSGRYGTVKTGKEVIEGRPLLHRLLGFKGRCKDCLQLIITEL